MSRRSSSPHTTPSEQSRTYISRQSGSIFVYEEEMSGIKRWTDGLTWSPSRILGDFLIYRELDGCLASKGNKRKPQGRDRAYKAGQNKDRLKETHCRPRHITLPAARDTDELQRSIVGSLINSYTFKTGGLVKKAISVTVSEVAFHLVSYYTIEDIVHGRLSTPCDMYQSVAFYPDSDVQRSIAGSELYNNTRLVRHEAWTGGQTNSESGERSTQPQWSIDYNLFAVTDYEQQQEQIYRTENLAPGPWDVADA